jgi:hypothetical protein
MEQSRQMHKKILEQLAREIQDLNIKVECLKGILM